MSQPNDTQAGVTPRAAANSLLALGTVVTIAGVILLVAPGPGLPVLTLGVLVLLVGVVLRLAFRR